MTTGGRLALRPELCDRCGACVRACPAGKLRVGAGYIYVDIAECTGCFTCVETCERGAIVRRTAPARPTAHAASVAPGEVGKVVVGSRAEAKAVRTAAVAAHKAREKSKPAGKAATATSKATPASSGRGPSTADEHPGAQWTLVDAAVVAAVLLATLVAKEAVLGSKAVSVMPAAGRIAARATVLGVFYVAQIAVLGYLARRRGQTLVQAFRLKAPSRDVAEIVRSTGLVLVLLVATRAASTLWGAISQGLGWTPPASEALTSLFGGGGVGLVLAVGMVVLVAPIAEELAFRGVIAGALAERSGRRVAIVASAAIFSAYHLSAWVALPTFVLGCALGWLALSRRTLWPAIALHALYNGVVVAAAFWLPGS